MGGVFREPRRRGPWLEVGAVALVAAALLAGCKKSHEALELFHEGRRVFYQQKDPRRAEALFLKALEIDPALTHLHMILGELYSSDMSRKAGLYSEERATRHLGEAVRLAPDHVGAHFLMGKIALRRGDISLAQEEFEATRRLLDWPFTLADTRAWRELQLYEGFLALDKGDLSGARAKFELFNSHYKKASYYLPYAGLMLAAAARGETEEQGRLRERLLGIQEPADPLAFQGVLLLWEGRPGEASEALRRQLGEMEREPPADEDSGAFLLKRTLYRRVLAWAYQRSGRPEEARKVLDGAGEPSRPPTIEVLKAVFSE